MNGKLIIELLVPANILLLIFVESVMQEAKLQTQNRRTLMILLGVLVTLVIITVVTVLVKN